MQRKKLMTDAELTAWESSRDLEAELLLSALQMATGKTTKVYTPAIAVRAEDKSAVKRRARPVGS